MKMRNHFLKKQSKNHLIIARLINILGIYMRKIGFSKSFGKLKIYATKDEKSGIDVYHKIESALFDLGRYSEVEKFYQKLISIR